MPTPDAILTTLTALANDWRWLAIAWHLIFVALLVALVLGYRPSARSAGYLLVAPVLAVAALASAVRYTADRPLRWLTV